MSASVATAGDRVAAGAAFEEAAMAAVVEDLVDEDTLEVLRGSSDEFDRSTGLPPPGSLSGFAGPAGMAVQGPLRLAVSIALVIACAAAWLIAGTGLALITLALGLVLTAGLAQRRTRPGA